MAEEKLSFQWKKLRLNNNFILPKLIGHRGVKDLKPENTIESVQKAFELGLECVEIDVKISKDNIPILIHDDTLDRTTTGSGLVCDYTYDELRNFEADAEDSEGLSSSSNSSVSSQLSNVNSKYDNNSKFLTFKRGGLEKPFTVPAYKCDAIISTAKSFLGTPHSSGGLSKSGIDCSGLVYKSVNSHSSNELPRVAQEMARCGTIISNLNDLIKGDLVFFTRTYNTSKFITHVGIYLGNNNFIHTSSSKGVSINSIRGSSYWESKFVYCTRILNWFLLFLSLNQPQSPLKNSRINIPLFLYSFLQDKLDQRMN